MVYRTPVFELKKRQAQKEGFLSQQEPQGELQGSQWYQDH